MTSDPLVQRLQRRLKNWNPVERCKGHSDPCCAYDQQGRLVTLHLCGLELTKIPTEVGQFSALQELELHGNQLRTLPAQFGQLTGLQRLGLSSNQLSTLPAEIGKLTNLQTLNLSFNQLRTLPAEIGKLTSLQWLNLSSDPLMLFQNQLSTLPAEIGKLTSLQWLNLSFNDLSTLPAQFGQLTGLQRLDLHSNGLSPLPAVIGKLTSLQGLDLSHNKLSTLPVEIGKLTSLQWLNLGGNQFGTLPAVIGQLTSLQTLLLPRNQLNTLPAELGQLTSLIVLDLDGNQLNTLPAEIGQLTSLQRLQLANNPWQMPPPEIMAQGTSAILAYLRALQKAPADQPAALPSVSNEVSGSENAFSMAGDVPVSPLLERFEAKVILVGEGGMGKTSLLRALQHQPFVEGLPATHGIEVGTLHVPHPIRSQQEVTLYTWDFGGQEIFQATHQFFFTHRSVYLLLWNARMGAETCRLRFWLDTITGHAPDAQVLLVATHADTDITKTPFFPLATYQQRYPQIVGLCTISNKTGEGLEDLK